MISLSAYRAAKRMYLIYGISVTKEELNDRDFEFAASCVRQKDRDRFRKYVTKYCPSPDWYTRIGAYDYEQGYGFPDLNGPGLIYTKDGKDRECIIFGVLINPGPTTMCYDLDELQSKLTLEHRKTFEKMQLTVARAPRLWLCEDLYP